MQQIRVEMEVWPCLQLFLLCFPVCFPLSYVWWVYLYDAGVASLLAPSSAPPAHKSHHLSQPAHLPSHQFIRLQSTPFPPTCCQIVALATVVQTFFIPLWLDVFFMFRFLECTNCLFLVLRIIPRLPACLITCHCLIPVLFQPAHAPFLLNSQPSSSNKSY